MRTLSILLLRLGSRFLRKNMLTLLLPEEQKKIKREYTLRLVVVSLSLLALLFLLVSFLLLPSYFLSRTKQVSVGEREVLLKKSDVSETARKAKAELEISRDEMKLLSGGFQSASSTLFASEALRALISKEGAGITIQTFSFIKKADAPQGKLVITGLSKTRADLVAFLQRIKKDSVFTTVDFPVSNLAKDTDINFTLNLSGNF